MYEPIPIAGMINGIFFKNQCPLNIIPMVVIPVANEAIAINFNPNDIFKFFLNIKANITKNVERTILLIAMFV